MRVKQSTIPGILVIELDVFEDRRGLFTETYHQKRYHDYGITTAFIQDNISFSICGTLRGMHYQHPHAQAKLIQVLQGEVYDVAVDIRQGSPTFGHWVGDVLSEKNRKQLFIPEGFAHGFCVLSDFAISSYKCSDFYAPYCEGGILWSDPAIGIEWPVKDPILSEKDSRYPTLANTPSEKLPLYGDQDFRSSEEGVKPEN